jgi:hypothetical protein
LLSFDATTQTSFIQLADTTIAIRFNSARAATFQRMLGEDPIVFFSSGGRQELFIASGVTAATLDAKSGAKWTPDRVMKKLDQHKEADDAIAPRFIARAIMLAYVHSLAKVDRKMILDATPELFQLEEEADEDAAPLVSTALPAGALPGGLRESFMGDEAV